VAATDWPPMTCVAESSKQNEKIRSATKKPAFADFASADFRIIPHFADLSIDNQPEKK
jgi:hypothetical protein